MRGKFPQTFKHFNSPNNDIKSWLGYFHITGTLPMSFNCILKFLRETRGKFPRGNIPRDSTGKGGGNIHIENSPPFPLNFHREIMRKFPQGWSPGIPLQIRVEIWGTWMARPLGREAWYGAIMCVCICSITICLECSPLAIILTCFEFFHLNWLYCYSVWRRLP